MQKYRRKKDTSVTESWSLATLFSPPSGVSSTRKGSPSLIKEIRMSDYNYVNSALLSTYIDQRNTDEIVKSCLTFSVNHLGPSLSADFFFLLLGPAPPSLGLRRT